MTAPELVITEPGVYPDVPDEVYHRDPVEGGSLSSTGARRLLPPSCPAKFRHLADNPEHKDEFDFGKAAHAVLLGAGPRIVVIDADNYKTKAAQQAKQDARDEGLIPVLPSQMDQVTAMVEAVRSHPVAGRLFRPGHGAPEQTLVWRDRRTGIMRRARLDWTQQHLVVDYKTCDKADPASCERSIHNWGYHQQGDWYLDGFNELGLSPEGRPSRFLLVFQEKTAPYLVVVVELKHESLMWGGVLNAKAIDIYRRCVETDTWPGYAIPGQGGTTDSDLVLAYLPPYALTGYERARERGDYDTKGESFR